MNPNKKRGRNARPEENRLTSLWGIGRRSGPENMSIASCEMACRAHGSLNIIDMRTRMVPLRGSAGGPWPSEHKVGSRVVVTGSALGEGLRLGGVPDDQAERDLIHEVRQIVDEVDPALLTHVAEGKHDDGA